MLPQVPITEDERADYLEANDGMPDGHYAKFGGEDLPGYPEVWQERTDPGDASAARSIGVNTWVWTSPLTDEVLPALLRRIAELGFDAVELPLENPGDLDPEATAAVLAETGLAPYVVGAMAPGPRPGRHAPGRRRRRRRTTCAPASTSPPRSGATGVCGPFYAATGRVWRMDAEERDAAYDEWREHLAPVAEHAGGAGRADRHRAAQPLRDVAGQHRRPGADRARAAARPGSGWPWTPTTSTSRSAPAPTPSGAAGEHLVHVQVCGSDRGRPGGDQTDWPALVAALDEVGYAGPLNIESFTPDNAAIAVAASIWRPLAASPDDLARDGLPFLRGPACTERPDHAADVDRSASPSSATRSWARPTPTRGATSARSTRTPRRSASRCWSAATRGAVKEAADRYGWAEAATDWRAVIERDDVDIVDICTPGHLHAEIAIAALEAGKHVLVEKPLANTVAEAEAMVAAAAAAATRGVRSMVGFNYRRVPALALARELIAEGRIGAVRQVRAAYLQDWLADDAAPMTWRLRKETRRLRRARRPRLARRRPGAATCSASRSTSASGHLRTFVPERHRRRRARAGHRRRRRLGDARPPPPARWPASRSAGWPPAARTA